MGISEAQKYIERLHKRQSNPMLWPDFLTGLPDKNAIIKKVFDSYPKGRSCVIYFRISNIQPYLIKYGPDRHAEIIQWAAAILKTTSDKYKAFVGVFGSHDFIVVSQKKDSERLIGEAVRLFEKKAETFYSPEDRRLGRLITFSEEGKDISVGLMTLISAKLCGEPIPKEQVIHHLGEIINRLEIGG